MMKTHLEAGPQKKRQMGHTVAVFFELAQSGVAHCGGCKLPVSPRATRFGSDEKSVSSSIYLIESRQVDSRRLYAKSNTRSGSDERKQQTRNHLWQKKLDSSDWAGWART